MKKLMYKRDTFPNCYLQQSIQALKKCVIIFIIVAVFTCIILSAKARFSLRRSENCVSIFYTLLGAKKKKVGHISKYFLPISKYLRHIFTDMKTPVKTLPANTDNTGHHFAQTALPQKQANENAINAQYA